MPKEIDEDLIEATIRRVAESQAGRGERPAIEMPVAESIAPAIAREDAEAASEASAIAARLSSVMPASHAPDTEEDDEDDPPPPTSLRMSMSGLPPTPMRMNPSKGAPAAATAPAPAPFSPPRTPDTSSQLQAIVERLDSVLPLLERLVARGSGEWDRDPAPPRILPGAAGRPAVILDASLRGAAPEPDLIDTRPIPKPLPPLVEPKRGLDLLPRTYRVTVEDKRRGVDLVPLHRAMLGIDGVRDMSLLSYNNGVAIVALETTAELDPELLRGSVSRAMARDARVEVHNENTMVVKLSEE